LSGGLPLILSHWPPVRITDHDIIRASQCSLFEGKKITTVVYSKAPKQNVNPTIGQIIIENRNLIILYAYCIK